MTQGTIAAATNCVAVRLPQGCTGNMRGSAEALRVLSFRQELESFGDVARAELQIEGGVPMMRVCYFDVRCAVEVKANYPDTCEFGPQEGDRTIRLTKAAMEAMQLADVSNVATAEDGDFLVEFFDVRAAAHAAELAAACGTEYLAQQMAHSQEGESLYAAWSASGETLAPGHWPSAAETSYADAPVEYYPSAAEPQRIEIEQVVGTPAAAKATQGSKPVKVASSLCMAQVKWGDLAERREWRTVLQLRGVPARLCEPGALEALLKTYNLLHRVASVRVAGSRGAGRGVGCAVVKAQTVEDIPVLAKFFHGSQFGSSMPIAVSFAPIHDGRAPQRIGGLGQLTQCGPVRGQPLRVQQASCRSTISIDSEDLSESTASGSPRSASSDVPSPVCSPQATLDLDSVGLPPGLADWVQERSLQAVVA